MYLIVIWFEKNNSDYETSYVCFT